MREKRARVTSVETIAPQVVELDFSVVEPARISFRAGQFVSIALPDGRGDRRSYSLASRAGREDGFRLLIRDTGGSGSRFVASLGIGDEISFYGPMGYFLLDDEHPGDVVFAATGVGVSAIVPMMEEVLGRPETRSVRFFWGLETRADAFWRDRLDRLGRDDRFASEIRYAAEGEGFITESVVATASTLATPTYYLCGNGLMVRDVTTGLLAAGIPGERLHTEAFAAPVAG